MSEAPLLSRIADLARQFLDTLPQRPVGARADLASLRSALAGALPTRVTALVERCCRLARRMADQLSTAPAVRILNEVVLNQVLVRFEPAGAGDGDAFTKAVVARVQREGTCWMAGSRWHGMDAMRISVSNWSTTEADIDRSAEAILAASRAEAEQGRKA
jgi:glutamate/tyrosine decarboxylase-like PLP-dependent enzyme